MLGSEPGAASDQDVPRLHVAVHEAVGVRRVERGAHLVEDDERLVGLQAAAAGDECGEVDTLDVAHGDVEDALCLSRVVDRDDVRVLEGGSRSPLLLEPLPVAGGLGQFRRENLERDPPPELQLLGEIDHAHSAPAHERFDPEATQHGADAVIRLVSHGETAGRSRGRRGRHPQNTLAVSSRQSPRGGVTDVESTTRRRRRRARTPPA